MIKKVKIKRGFTLIELVIGITLLTVGIVSVFSVALFSINLNQENMMKVQALELCREGMEIVRNIRDSNWKNNYPPYHGTPIWGESLDTAKTVLVSPSFEDNIPWIVRSIDLSQKESYRVRKLAKGESYVFTHAEGEETPFYRYIEIVPLDQQLQPSTIPSDILSVTAHVLWTDGGKEKQVELSTIITNWRKI